MLCLGEFKDSQQVAWRKSLEVFDERRRACQTLSLFPDDRPLPADAVHGVRVKLSAFEAVAWEFDARFDALL